MPGKFKLTIPERVASFCSERPERRDWLEALPPLVEELCGRWELTLDAPFRECDASSSWVAPVRRADGQHAVLKIGVPHFEAQGEIEALEYLDGDPTVYLLEAEPSANAMLLERCDPGTSLRQVSVAEQDVIVARLLQRFWRRPAPERNFRPLAAMIQLWCDATRRDRDRWRDAPLVGDGLAALEELARPSPDDVLLATDLHAGNVLRARRQPWLVIDPKPFVGDAAYDATQHLLNTLDRVTADPTGSIAGLAGKLDVDADRVRLWLFARLAAEPRESWDADGTALAAALRS
jgi:streptomycin 6-kinase